MFTRSSGLMVSDSTIRLLKCTPEWFDDICSNSGGFLQEKLNKASKSTIKVEVLFMCNYNGHSYAKSFLVREKALC